MRRQILQPSSPGQSSNDEENSQFLTFRDFITKFVFSYD
jgi:hypothetical protein